MAPARALRTEVPEPVASRSDVAGSHRALTFELPYDRARAMTAQEWARATFEGAPRLVRWFLVFGFRVVLGLRLDRAVMPQVLGWRLTEQPPDTATLAAQSYLIDGYNIVTVHDESVEWTTLVRYRRGAARPVWRLVELFHRVLMPYLLTHAGRAHTAVRS
jgi:hypothetical protein